MAYNPAESDAIRRALDLVLSHPEVRGHPDAVAVLEYMVGQHLAGATGPVPEKTLGKKAVGLTEKDYADRTPGDVREAIQNIRLALKLVNTDNTGYRFQLPKQEELPVKRQGYQLLIVPTPAPPTAGGESGAVPTATLATAPVRAEALRGIGTHAMPVDATVLATSLSNSTRPLQATEAVGPIASGHLRPADQAPSAFAAVASIVIAELRRYWWLIVLVLIIAAILFGRWRYEERPGFRVLGDQGLVQTVEYVEGVGPDTALNRYLVVEETVGGRRYVQERLTDRRWRVRAQFGESVTPDGTKFRVYVFVTAANLPNGEIAEDVPRDSRPPFEAEVILKK